jgi:hypothetical protein
MVFSEASITTAMVFMNKSKKDAEVNALVLKEKNYDKKQLQNTISSSKSWYDVKLLKDNVFALVNESVEKLNAKIDSKGEALDSLLTVGKGMETAANSVFLFDEYPKQFPEIFIKKRVLGENIYKYSLHGKEQFILYFEGVSEFEALPTSIQKHLAKHKKTLQERATVKNEARAWWRYARPMHKELYHLPKIWCSYRAKHNAFVLDESDDYIGLTNTTVIFETDKKMSLKYALALLNSQLLTFRYKSIGKQTGGGVYEYFANGVGKLPIPKISQKAQQPFIEKVEKIIAAKKADTSTDASALEAEIDHMVYALYGLTKEEIALVEKG